MALGSGPRQLEAVRRGPDRLRRGRDIRFILAPDPDHGLAVRAAVRRADGAVPALAGMRHSPIRKRWRVWRVTFRRSLAN